MAFIISLLVLIAVTAAISALYGFFEQKLSSAKTEKLILRKEAAERKTITGTITGLLSPVLKSTNPYIANYRNSVEKKIFLAGKPAGYDFGRYIAMQAAAFVIFMVLFFLLFEKFSFLNLIICILISFSIPYLHLNSKIQQRHREISRTLPDVLDLLVLSMEAGLDFSAALNKYLEKGEKGQLHGELFMVQQEMQMGKTRIDALKSMDERLSIPSVNSITTSIIQALELGSSLTPVLKVQAEQLRIQRFQAAEKMAAEAPTKMLFPLLFFIFPTVFIILFGPIILSFLKG